MENYYETLGCAATASARELRQAFQRLALLYHPDKAAAHADKDAAADRFVAVDRAWKVLGDAEKRKVYDAQWQQRCLAQEWPIQEEVHIGEFEREDEEYVHACRCGGEFVLQPEDADVKMDFVLCHSCSLCIKVLYEE